MWDTRDCICEAGHAIGKNESIRRLTYSIALGSIELYGVGVEAEKMGRLKQLSCDGRIAWFRYAVSPFQTSCLATCLASFRV